MTLTALSQRFGYSEFYISRKFRETSGMQLQNYLRYCRLTFALKEVRDTDKRLLEIGIVKKSIPELD